MRRRRRIGVRFGKNILNMTKIATPKDVGIMINENVERIADGRKNNGALCERERARSSGNISKNVAHEEYAQFSVNLILKICLTGIGLEIRNSTSFE